MSDERKLKGAERLINPPLVIDVQMEKYLEAEKEEALRCLREKIPYVPLWWQRRNV